MLKNDSIVIWILCIIIQCCFIQNAVAYEMKDCIACHCKNHGLGIPQISIKDYMASVHGKVISCQGCHSNIDEQHVEGKVPGSVDCGKCHPTECGKRGYFAWFTSFRVKSHKKEDFSRDFSETDCIGCHQGAAIHGEPKLVNSERCYRCHMNNSRDALMGRFHPVSSSKASVIGLSVLIQILMLIVLAYVVRFFIIRPLRKSGKREE